MDLHYSIGEALGTDYFGRRSAGWDRLPLHITKIPGKRPSTRITGGTSG
jgi:hypothetical protein